MSAVERRRCPRVPVFEGEAAVIHAVNRDIPVTIVDLSCSGALVCMTTQAPDSSAIVDDERLELSIHHEQSILQLAARVVRTPQPFMAVEFIHDAESMQKLEAKLQVLQRAKASHKVGSAPAR